MFDIQPVNTKHFLYMLSLTVLKSTLQMLKTSQATAIQK